MSEPQIRVSPENILGTFCYVTEDEIANLPPGSFVLPRDEGKMPEDRGGMVYLDERHYGYRPMTDQEIAAYRKYYERLGRELLPWMLPKTAGA